MTPAARPGADGARAAARSNARYCFVAVQVKPLLPMHGLERAVVTWTYPLAVVPVSNVPDPANVGRIDQTSDQHLIPLTGVFGMCVVASSSVHPPNR